VRQSRREHLVNILLPMALLLVFAVSALAVLLFATRIYQNTIENSALSEVSGTAVSYISEKIHSGDSAGSVRLEKRNGTDMLVLAQTLNGEVYETCVYEYRGELKELFIKAGADMPLSSGRTITQLKAFSVSAVGDDLLLISCTDPSGKTVRTMVALRSEGGAAK